MSQLVSMPWDCELCGTKSQTNEFCSVCGAAFPHLTQWQNYKQNKTQEIQMSLDTFFIQKTLENYDAQIKLLENRIERMESMMTSAVFSGLQSMQMQFDALVELSISKGVITAEEMSAELTKLQEELTAMMHAREEQAMQEAKASAPAETNKTETTLDS